MNVSHQTYQPERIEPTFHDGDDLRIEFSEDLNYDEIGIFVADEVGYVKEYQKDELYSHNPEYTVLRFNDNDNVHYIGHVGPNQLGAGNLRRHSSGKASEKIG